MKKMILTALATEQSFANKGEAQYYLVFNDGELRVPVSEEAAKEVVAMMYGGQEEEETESHGSNGNGHTSYERPDDDVYDEDGVGQV